jgi:hypothetical protein
MDRHRSFRCRHAALALAALLLATLAPASSPAQPAARGAAGELGGYRQVLADAIAETFKSAKSLSAFQAGLLRVSRAPQPGDYAVCLQTIENGRIAYFAAFIAAGEVDSIRRAVGVDRCWMETNYSPLPRPGPPKKKKPWERQTAG